MWQKLSNIPETPIENIVTYGAPQLGLHAIAPHRDYYWGDGSLNMTGCAYDNLLMVNGYEYKFKYVGSKGAYGTNTTNLQYCNDYSYETDYTTINSDLVTDPRKMAATWVTLYYCVREAAIGTYDNKMAWLFNASRSYNLSHEKGNQINIYYGDNNFTFIHPLTAGSTGMFCFGAGGLTTGVYINNLKFIVNNEAYTLKQLVENQMIKPLVLLGSQAWSSRYVWYNALNTYEGGQTTSSNYPTIFITLMTDVDITGF